jgi:hypothetical protein
MAGSKAKTVAAYLKELPADRRKVVSTVRDLVRKHLPDGYDELMGYGMIMFSVPLSRLPNTYNGHPLCYVALAAQKNYYALYLMCVYNGSAGESKFQAEYRKTGKKLDMGKSCVRFKSLDDLPLDLIARTVASVPMETYVAMYHKSRSERPA